MLFKNKAKVVMVLLTLEEKDLVGFVKILNGITADERPIIVKPMPLNGILGFKDLSVRVYVTPIESDMLMTKLEEAHIGLSYSSFTEV